MSRVVVDPEQLRRDLEKVVGSKRVSMREVDLATYSRDMWPRPLIAKIFATPGRHTRVDEHRPHAVVWPESEREVVALVRVARSRGVPIIPYGGGSGVCGGVVPLRGGITVDLKRMNAMGTINRDDMLCEVQAGMNGERFERELERLGYTFGHFPSSIYCSTVGGWLATRAAGQMSTKYGKVEDRVAGLTLVTGEGDILRTDSMARAARGPNWTQLILGSEGTLGIITSARLRLALQPAVRFFRGYEFADVATGVEAIRRVMQRGIKPAVVRLYDELDTFLHGMAKSSPAESAFRDPQLFGPIPAPGTGSLPPLPGPGGKAATGGHRPPGLVADLLGMADRRGKSSWARNTRHRARSLLFSRPRLTNALATTVVERVSRKGCRMIVGLEGARIRTEVEAGIAFNEFERAGGHDLGEEPGWAWLERRYAVSYQMSPTFRGGSFVDTMEVAATWERLMDLYDAVRETIGRYALVLAHFSHAYEEGCSIYFTFVGQSNSAEQSEQLYDRIWRESLAAANRVGGTISHHHGVGLLKAPYMRSEHREAMKILHAVKETMDPDNIMNPGKLGFATIAGSVTGGPT